MSALYLIGFRGAGKTTLGRRLAAQLGCEFFDCDEEWEKREKRTIVDFVGLRGIEAFRAGEEAVLSESLALAKRDRGLVVATGGGFVDWLPSLELLAQSPWPRIYLESPAEELWERLRDQPHRLEIGHLGSLQALRALLEKRRPAYEKIATYRLKNQDISGALIELAGLAEKIKTPY